MAGIDCVNETDLRAFLVGELAEPITAAIARHLESCSACEALAQRMDSLTDPFVSSLRLACLPAAANSSESQPIPNRASSASIPGKDDSGTEIRQSNSAGYVGRVIGCYAIIDELGRGGMSVVYRARQKRPERLVALKMLLSRAHASTEWRLRF